MTCDCGFNVSIEGYDDSREGLIMGGRKDCVCLPPPLLLGNKGGRHTGSRNSCNCSGSKGSCRVVVSLCGV